MMDNLHIYIISFICALGYGWSQYKSGVAHGAEKLLEILDRENIIDVDDNGNVTPGSKKV